MEEDTHDHRTHHLARFVQAGVIVIVVILAQFFLRTPSASPPTATNEPISLPNPAATATSTSWTITRVVDGDTFDVTHASSTERVRLLGVNTPETVDPRRPVECFGKEASAFAKVLLTNKEIRLEPDPLQDDRDIYQRLLRYAYLEDGTFVNKKLITEGFAYEYTYRKPYYFQTEFKLAQEEAKKAGRGLWAADACSGQ